MIALVVPSLLRLALAIISVGTGAPPLPTVTGPRQTTHTHVSYRFHAARAKRYLCSVDSAPLRSCDSPVALVFSVGSHTLRVQALDSRGRRSPISKTRIVVVAPPLPSVSVGSQPLNVIEAGGAVWTENYGSGTISRVDLATRKA